ncbi:MAG: DMT family transporter [Agarilytica sp.]
MHQREFLPILVLALACIFWGTSWYPLRLLNGLGFNGLFIILFAHVLLALTFLPAVRRSDVSKRNGPYLVGIAIAGGLAIFSFTYALIYGDVVRVMVLFYLLPVWGVLGGRIFLQERIDRFRWLGVGLALIGAFLILGGAKIFEAPPSWMDALALLSGMGFAANNLLFRGVGHLSLPTKLFSMFAGCAFITGVLFMLGASGSALPVSSLSNWAWLLLYTFTWLLLANLGSQWAVERMEAGRSSIIIIVELLAAIFSAMLIDDKRLSGIEWLGCVLVVSAALLEAHKPNLGDKREQLAKGL